MANQVANAASGGAIAALQGLKKGIANVKATLVKKGGDPFLRLLKDGTWVYGQEDTEVEAGSAWAINPLSIQHGWVAWERGEEADNSKGPEQEVMVPCSMTLPSLDTLPKLARAQRYDQQFAFTMVCLTGEDKGEQVLYKNASVGGVAMVDTILNAISSQLDDDPENPVPVVVLSSSYYQHKKHGKTYTPIMTIKMWKPLTDDLPTVEDLQDADETTDVQTQAEQPAPEAKRTRKASVPTTKPAVDEDPELAALEAAIAAKKAAKDKAAQLTVDDGAAEKARRRAELQAQLDAMEAGEGEDAGEAGGAAPETASAQPIRRRRNV